MIAQTRVAALAVAACTFGTALLPGVAEAYVGPGAGLSAIGTLVALVGAVLLAIVGFVWYPIKRLLRRGKEDTAKPVDVEQTGEARESSTEGTENPPLP
jgi:hypothetical protein